MKVFPSTSKDLVKFINSQDKRENIDGCRFTKNGWPKLELSQIKKEDGSSHMEILPLNVVFVFNKRKKLLGAYNYKD